MSLTPMFSMSDIDRDIKRFRDKAQRKTVESLAYIGEEFVNRARLKTPDQGSYRDRTGNLRSSIGYLVAIDGEIQIQKTEGDKPEGLSAGDQLAEELAEEHNGGIVLIVYAGMNYAAAVESRNYDVITGSAPAKSELESLLKEFGVRT